MTVDEIRFIARQQSPRYFSKVFKAPWITNQILDEALSQIDEVYRSRLMLAIGVERKNLGLLNLHKIHGGEMKPNLTSVCCGISRALRNLSWKLNDLKPPKPKQEWESVIAADGHLTCPHCGHELEFHWSGVNRMP